MNNKSNTHNDGNAGPRPVAIELETSPVIIPLEMPPPRGKAIFNIIATEIVSEYRAKRLSLVRFCRWCCYWKRPIYEHIGDEEEPGRTILNNGNQMRTEHYRRIRQEFLFFACFYGMLAILACFTFVSLLIAIYGPWWKSVHGEKWNDCHGYASHCPGANYQYTRTGLGESDDIYSYHLSPQDSRTFFQRIHDFFFGDTGFADDDDASF